MKIIEGVMRYREQTKLHYAELFSKLAKGQSPHTMFITCADSRIDPGLITSSDPGELFVVRNIGNIIPPFGADSLPSEGAALEYAVGVLGVDEIIVCGHTSCGAIQALVAGTLPPEHRSLNDWLREVRELCTHERVLAQTGMSDDATLLNEVSRENAVHQLDNLRTYPSVRNAEASGRLQLHAWYFDIAHGELDGWVPLAKKFVRLSDPNLPPASYEGAP